MDLDQLLGRVLRRIDRKAMVTPGTERIEDERERAASDELLRRLGAPGLDVAALRADVGRLRADGLIGDRRAAILLMSVAAHPAVSDLEAMARHIAEEEYAVLREGGDQLDRRRALVLHHRAVLAFLLRRYDVALDLETRAIELAVNADSLANLLAILLRLGEEDRARDLYAEYPAAFGRDLAAQVGRYIEADPDLELLRDAVPAADEGAPPCDTLLH